MKGDWAKKKARSWASDLADRYDKKYRKYLKSKYSMALPSIASTPPPPQPLAVSANIPHTTAMQMGTAQYAQYQQMVQAQLMNQMAQAQAAVIQGSSNLMWQSSTNAFNQSTTVTLTNVPTGYYIGGTGTSNTSVGTNPYYATTTLATTGLMAYDPVAVISRLFKVQQDEECNIELPDGSVIRVDAKGSYQIDDKAAKVVYKANRSRDFNKFINVSDQIEDFFKFCGELDVSADEMLDLPVRHFVGWLVLKAAETDKEAPPEGLTLIPDLRARAAQPRCRACKRFLGVGLKKAGLEYCSGTCYDRALSKLLPLKGQARLAPPTEIPFEVETIAASHLAAA